MNSAISDLFTTFSIGAATILLGHLAAWTLCASSRSFPDQVSKRASILNKFPPAIAFLLPLSVLFGLGALVRSIECSDCGLVAPLDFLPALCVLAWIFLIIFGLILLWALGTWIFWVNRSSNSSKKKDTKRAGKKRERSRRMLVRSLATGIILLFFSFFFCCEKNDSDCDSSPSCAASPAAACALCDQAAVAPAPDCAFCEKSPERRSKPAPSRKRKP